MNMNYKDVKVYVYGLLDDDGETVTYIGKSTSPKQRLSAHCIDGHCSSRKMIIIDIFYDTEYRWIHKYLKDGHPLKNNEVTPQSEDWKIGEIVEHKQLRVVKFKDLRNNIVYNSIKDAAAATGMSRYIVSQLLYNKNYRKIHSDEYEFEILSTTRD